MPNYHKRYRSYSRAGEVQGAIWLIGLGVLFLTGFWWPGILIVIGLSMVAGTLAREWDPPEAPAEPRPAPPVPTFTPPAPPPAFQTAPPSPVPAARSTRLPDLCPNCGAPPRTLAQRGENPGLCPYCGSNIGLE